MNNVCERIKISQIMEQITNTWEIFREMDVDIEKFVSDLTDKKIQYGTFFRQGCPVEIVIFFENHNPSYAHITTFLPDKEFQENKKQTTELPLEYSVEMQNNFDYEVNEIINEICEHCGNEKPVAYLKYGWNTGWTCKTCAKRMLVQMNKIYPCKGGWGTPDACKVAGSEVLYTTKKLSKAFRDYEKEVKNEPR